jgi:hypothetical protein
MRQSNLPRALSMVGRAGLVVVTVLSGALTVSADPAPPAQPTPAMGVSPASPWRSCLRGFAPHEDPRLDVLRLGVACGPVTGLTRLAHVVSQVDETAAPAVLRFTADKHDCFRLFGVAGQGVDDLEVEIVGPHASRVTLVNQNRRWVVVGEGAPFCTPAPGDYEAHFTTHAGRAPLAAAIYRGADMSKRGSPFAPGAGSDSEIPY